jgi:hypothetical protein
MKVNLLLILLFFGQNFVFAQNKNLTKIAKYIEKGKGVEAKQLLDELDVKNEYQSDVYYWYVRTVYYRNIAVFKSDATYELAEARKSFEKLVEFNEKDPSKSLNEFIPQIRKDLFEGKNLIKKSKSIAEKKSVIPIDGGEKTVTLTQIGLGKTKDAAKYNALRNAIEKAFGIYISENTTLLNDEIVKDEIVAFTSGNIQNFEILSETQMPDGSFSSVVKTTVSIDKLTKFCESKGVSVVFKGALFAANIKLQKINRENEEAVMKNLFYNIRRIVENGFDYTLTVSEPKKSDINNNLWEIPIIVNAKPNINIFSAGDIILKTIRGVSLSETERLSLHSMNIKSYRLNIDGKEFYFRNWESIVYLKELFENTIPKKSLNFQISNGLRTLKGTDIIHILNANISDLSYSERHKKNYELIGYTSKNDEKYINVNYPVLRTRLDDNSPYSSDGSETILRFLKRYPEIPSLMTFDSSNEIKSLTYKGEYIILKLNNLTGINFAFNLGNILTEEELTKIAEYKILPITKFKNQNNHD